MDSTEKGKAKSGEVVLLENKIAGLEKELRLQEIVRESLVADRNRAQEGMQYEMRLKLEAWALRATAESKLSGTTEWRDQALRIRDEALARAAKAEAISDPLRRELSLAHRSTDELRKKVVAHEQTIEAARLRLADMTRKFDAVDSSLSMMQTARNKAQALLAGVIRERDDALEESGKRGGQVDDLISSLKVLDERLAAVAGAHREHGDKGCRVCQALGRHAAPAEVTSAPSTTNGGNA